MKPKVVGHVSYLDGCFLPDRSMFGRNVLNTDLPAGQQTLNLMSNAAFAEISRDHDLVYHINHHGPSHHEA